MSVLGAKPGGARRTRQKAIDPRQLKTDDQAQDPPGGGQAAPLEKKGLVVKP